MDTGYQSTVLAVFQNRFDFYLSPIFLNLNIPLFALQNVQIDFTLSVTGSFQNLHVPTHVHSKTGLFPNLHIPQLSFFKICAFQYLHERRHVYSDPNPHL